LSSFNSLEEMMEELGGTEGHNKVLREIVRLKDTEGDFVPGKIQITYRDLAKKAGVSLGTVARAFIHWEHKGVIVVHAGANRRDPNTIQYQGVPPEDQENPLMIIKSEFDELTKLATMLSEQVVLMQKQLSHLIDRERTSEYSAFRDAKPVQIGDLNGKPIYILEDNMESINSKDIKIYK